LRRVNRAVVVPKAYKRPASSNKASQQITTAVANNLLRRLHNELNLGEVLILLEKIFFDLAHQSK